MLHCCGSAALTEVLLPKQVVIGTPSACQQHLQQLKTVNFVAAFTSPDVQQEADQLWEQLGRAGPPLFLKVRSRAMLQDTEKVGRVFCVCLSVWMLSVVPVFSRSWPITSYKQSL